MYKLIDENGKEYLSDIPGTLGGNKKLKIYGRLDCPSANNWIEKGHYIGNRVFFLNEETAIKAGYRPCVVCMKKEYEEWKKHQEELRKLSKIDNSIKECNLCDNKVEKFNNNKTVSIGNKKDIVILGEAPANNGWRKSGVAWYDINKKLLPSGVVLQKLLDIIDYKIEDTYFLEAIKCYPLDRKYLKICSSNCKKYLMEQIKIINPKIILPLGDTATKSLLDIKYKNFSDVVGQSFDYNGFDVIPIYHPSPISPLSYKGNVDIFENIIKEKVLKK